MSPQTFIRAWYAGSFTSELILIYPVYAIMMGEAGVAPLELAVLFMVWSGAVVVLEVPSGALADRYPRRTLLILGYVIKAGAFAIWLAWPAFAGYLLGFVCWSVSSSLRSGTAEALLADRLAADGHPDFARVYGRGRAFGEAGVATALTLGGLAAESGYALPLVLSIAMPFVTAGIIAAFVPEPPRRGEALAGAGVTGALTTGLAEVAGSPALRSLVIAFALLPTTYGVLEEYFGPFIVEAGELGLAEVGWTIAVAYLARTAGMAWAYRLPARSTTGAALLFLLAGGALAAALGGGVLIVAGLAGYGLCSAAGEVVLQDRLQAAIRTRARATVTSLAGMAMETVSIVYYLVIGAIAQSWTWQAAFGAFAAFTLVLAAVLASLSRVRERPPPETSRR